jgi:hypothetical protein
MPGSPKQSPSLRFPHQNPVYACLLPCTCYMPANLILLNFITRTILGEEYRSFAVEIGFIKKKVHMSETGIVKVCKKIVL